MSTTPPTGPHPGAAADPAIRFFGGKGGVGKTTLAAARALVTADSGISTLVVSTDPAHSLGDVFGIELGDEPTRVTSALWAAEISGEQQADRRVERIVADAEQALPREVLPAVRAHLDRAVASPGTVESALLDRLTELIEQVPDRWSRLVVDSAPTGHMLRLLTLPTLLTPWIEGLTRQRERARRVGEMAAGITDQPAEQLDPLLQRLHTRRDRMEAMRARLLDDAVVQLVTVAEQLALAETLRAASTVRDAGLHLDQVLCNRILPESDAGVLHERKTHEQTVLRELRERFADLGVVEIPMLAGALTGVPELRQLAAQLT